MDHTLRELCFVCFNLSRGYLKGSCKVLAFISPNLELYQGGRVVMQRTFIDNIVRQMNNLLLPGAKDYNKGKNETPTAWKEKLEREFL